ncbi:MAG: ABC transporter permease [Acidobacteria bacterium]|nr:ABC transporter permease [Acidobacteriota bacterium]
MKALRFAVIATAVVLSVAFRLWRRRRRRDASASTTPTRRHAPRQFVASDVGLVMGRELRERLRSHFYLLGTIAIVLVVGAAIVIPTLTHPKSTSESIGVVGTLSTSTRSWLATSGQAFGVHVRFVEFSDVAHARTDVSSGRVDFAVVNGLELVVKTGISPGDTSTTAYIVQALAARLGTQRALAAAHLSAQQAATLAHSAPVPIVALHRAGPVKHVNATSIIGVILIFVMLQQYNTWILMGVMEEKASRVIEVLLSTVRPVRLLAGKVMGIGLAALLQASVVVAFALVVSSVVGSDLLHGTGTAQILGTLVWLVLGYSLYSWVYAAAGSMAERQDQIQSLALPLSLPLIVGYVVTLTAASSPTPSLLLKVFAYIPLTAPFAMTALVGFGGVAWWQFALSALTSIVCTLGIARLATGIYRRAILRTGRRVRLKDVRRST